MAKESKTSAAIKSLPKRAESEADDPAFEDRKDPTEKRQSLYLPIPVHEQLRELAYTKRVSQQELFRRALDMLFADEGLPSWDELAPRK